MPSLNLVENLSKEDLLTLSVANSILQSRIENTIGLGQMYGGDRDIYEALGLPKTLSFEDLNSRYKRKGYGRRVVELYPKESWKKIPTITDRGDPKNKSKFETDFEELAKNLRLWHWLLQVDIQSGINQYAVLYIGSGGDTKEPLESGEITYLRAFNDSKAKITTSATSEKDRITERYGQPEAYGIQFGDSTSNYSRTVHHSRVIHVADNIDSSPIYGSSRLEPVFNNVVALEMILSGDAEGFWRANISKYHADAKPDAKLASTFGEDMGEKLKTLIHNFQQYIVTQGVDLETLAPDIADPTSHADANIAEICTTLGCPRRVFEGSERGELASSQDGKNWAGKMDKRRSDQNEHVILRPFIDRAIEIKAISEPEGGGYSVDWPPLIDDEPSTKAQTAKTISEAIAAYTNSLGADSILPPESFFAEVLGWDQEKIKRVAEARESVARIDREGRENAR
jgi:hypothetical protein